MSGDIFQQDTQAVSNGQPITKRDNHSAFVQVPSGLPSNTFEAKYSRACSALNIEYNVDASNTTKALIIAQARLNTWYARDATELI